jgi:hypothetical protein
LPAFLYSYSILYRGPGDHQAYLIRKTFGNCSKSRNLFRLIHPLDRRRGPGAVQDRLFGPVEAHDEVEAVLGRRQPVGLTFFAGGLRLDIEIKRTVGIEPQGAKKIYHAALKRLQAIIEALDGGREPHNFEPWKKMVEERSGSFPAGMRWFLLNKLF